MRIVLEPTTDGRWQIWIDEWPEGSIPPGVWGGTYTPRAVPARVRQLVIAAQSASLAELRRRVRASKS